MPEWQNILTTEFQSPPPRRGRLHKFCACSWALFISIPAPAQGATLGIGNGYIPTPFQSPPPRRGRRETLTVKPPRRNFNPRPRAGGDYQLLKITFTYYISIPAPAQGATDASGVNIRQIQFQSPPPRRGRPVDLALPLLVIFISIPAPAQGATWYTEVPGP